MTPNASQRPWWRRFRISLRALLVLVLVVGAALGWYMRRVIDQREAVRAVIAEGGSVRYDFEQPWRASFPAAPPGPNWLVRLLGVDFFADVVQVKTGPQSTEATFANIGRLRRLTSLGARSTPVTDAGLADLAGLSELRTLSIQGTTGLTDAGLAHFAGLEQLESLWIEGSYRINGPGLAHLAGLSHLESLIVDTMPNAGLPILTRLTGLRKLIYGPAGRGRCGVCSALATRGS